MMSLINTIKHRRKVNHAIRELSLLSNETLRDIGIERGNIPQMVEQMMAEDAKLSKMKHNRHESAHPVYGLTDGAAA